MTDQRPRPLAALVLMARLAILAGIVAGVSGVGRVVADGVETGIWEPERAMLWVLLGLLPMAGGWATGRLLRGPGNTGLVSVATITLLLGVGVAVLWVVEGMARR